MQKFSVALYAFSVNLCASSQIINTQSYQGRYKPQSFY